MDSGDVDDDFGDDNFQRDFVAVRNAIVFCIDASEKMLQVVNGKCDLQLCFESVKKRLRHNIFVSDKEYIGIVLMGSVAKASSSANLSKSNSTVYFELARPSAEICSTLESLAEKDGDKFKSDFFDEYDVCAEGSLSDTLWTCSSLLSLSNIKFTVKEIFIMTNNSYLNMDPNTRRQTLKRVEALAQVGICLRLLFIGAEFDFGSFFKDLLMVAHPETAMAGKFHWAATDLVNDADSILTRACHNRQLARLDFSITPAVKITVKAFSLFRRKDHVYTRQNVKLFKETNEQVTMSSNRYDKTSGELVHADSLVYGIKVDNGASYFKKEERSAMKDLYPIEITLLGFKLISEVFWGDHIRPGLMILPDDEERAGSSNLFYSLHKVCIEDNKSPLVRVCLRKGSAARMAHLLPQLENTSESPFATVNSFYLIYMPFNGECREPNLNTSETVDIDTDLSAVEKVAGSIIKKTTFKFLPNMFPNPKIQMHFNAVEALAMDYKEAKEVEDALQPDPEDIDARIGHLSRELMELSREAAEST